MQYWKIGAGTESRWMEVPQRSPEQPLVPAWEYSPGPSLWPCNPCSRREPPRLRSSKLSSQN